MDIDELLTTLRGDLSDAQRRVDDYEREAETSRREVEVLAARIQGIEEARAALTSPEDEHPISARKPRRDIRAMVRFYRGDSPDCDAAEIARAIGCRVSQVEAALRAINGQGSAAPTPAVQHSGIQPD